MRPSVFCERTPSLLARFLRQKEWVRIYKESRESLRAERRGVLLDSDLLKVKVFSLFEGAGEMGLQLKQIATHTQQPLSHVKSVVEEIAEQRKWGTLSTRSESGLVGLSPILHHGACEATLQTPRRQENRLFP